MIRQPAASVSPAPRSRVARFAVATAAIFGLVASLLIGVTAEPADAAVDPCGLASNRIVCENSKPGTDPVIWDIRGAGDPTIQGFGTDISVNVGATIGFKVSTPAPSYRLDIYRTGYYQGLGARFITTVSPSATLPQSQPPCASEAATGLTDCGNWGISASWAVPSTAVSGVYIAVLHRNDTGGESHIIFVVRDDASRSDVLFQTSDPTWQAYNTYGGSSFYQGGAASRAYKLSYNRPFATREGVTARDFYFSSEFAQVQFLEQNGYDLTYAAGVDTDRNGSLLLNHRVFLSVGHDEYWSTGQRANVETARDAGVNLQFLSGNEVYWHTRYEASTVDPTSNGYRTLVSYKETWSNAKLDPSSTWTGTWRDPRFASPSAGAGRPENALTGSMYRSNDDDLPITVTADQGKTRLWRGTSLTSLAAGASQPLAPHTVGYESNEVVDNGFSPAGLVTLSTTVGPSPQILQDFGSTVAPGTTTHNLTLYRAPSGALVFGAGTIQWAWGLTQNHDGAGAPADPRMQQAQVNILADMSAQPLTLMSGLVAALRSSDVTAPTVTIVAPASNTTPVNGEVVTVSGTAQDVGGVVAGVEVSTDGGTAWHRATGTSMWSYSYSQSGLGAQATKVRATDDSANTSLPTTLPLAVTGPASVFGAETPLVIDSADPSPTELGLTFTPDVNGFVTGVRFYKSAANGGNHSGSLWSATGALLARVTFTNETASGWQTAQFSNAVSATAGQKYTVSYTAPSGRYSSGSYYWTYWSRLSPPLSVPHAYGAASPGVFGNPGTYPTSSYRDTNYYVDVLFSTQNVTPLSVSSRYPLADSTCAGTATAVTAWLAGTVTPSTVSLSLRTASGSSVAGSSTFDAGTAKVTLTPTTALAPGTAYTATITATGAAGGLTTGQTWTFTTAAAGNAASCPTSIFSTSTVPVVPLVSDSPVTLGVTFNSSSDGSIVGMRFFKGSKNTATHTGTLWSSTGTSLATATFVGESASGWQSVYFSQPVAITAGTKYVASYRSTSGNYSTTTAIFGQAYQSGFLTVPASGAVYGYSDGFPSSPSSTNYFVDVLFAPPGGSGTPLPMVTSSIPAAGAAGVATSTTISAVLSTSPVTVPSIAVSAGTVAVAGATTYTASTSTLTFTPTAPLAAGTTYSAVVASGSIPLAGGSWSFTTAGSAPTGTSYSLISGLPVTESSTDASAVELGMAFTASQAGTVTQIRFFKGAGNTGTHRGSVWSSTGTRLASVTFTGETATGWQTATLASPLALTAGTTYIVSYFAPVGRYSVTANYFSVAKTSGPLTATATTNGRYVYGSTGGFPTASYQATNYFVDVTFVTSTPVPVSVVSMTPTPAAVGVPTSTSVTAVMSGDSTTGTPAITLTGPGGAVAGTSAYSSATKTVSFVPSVVLAESTAYAATVSVGATVVNGGTWTFTTGVTTAPSSQYSLISGTPTIAANSDTSAVELGMAFSASQAGSVTAIRFYKGTGNTGTHTGSLWSTSGARLASVTFSGETASGWQTATLSTPYGLSAGTTYIVSYLAPNGGYSSTPSYFTAARTSGPLTADTSNGRYLYGAAGGMPASVWNSTNYFVDIVFAPATTSTLATMPAPVSATTSTLATMPAPATTPVPTASDVTVGVVSPAAGATDVAPTISIAAAVSGADAATASIAVTSSTSAVPGTSTYSVDSGRVTFTPTVPLGWLTGYTATVSSGSTQIGSSWSFTTTTVPVTVTAQSIFAADAMPANVNWNDTATIQVGTRFSTSVVGTVTTIRFYKGPTNTGTHTGYLWSATGMLLATVSFSGESASGWQQASLSTPVILEPGLEYRVGLLSTTGMYSVDLNGLGTAMTRGSLSTPANGGAYVSGNAFLSTTSAHNYWVDVAFVPMS